MPRSPKDLPLLQFEGFTIVRLLLRAVLGAVCNVRNSEDCGVPVKRFRMKPLHMLKRKPRNSNSLNVLGDFRRAVKYCLLQALDFDRLVCIAN